MHLLALVCTFFSSSIGTLMYQFHPLKSYWAALMYAFIFQPGYVLKARSVRSACTVVCRRTRAAIKTTVLF